MIKTLNKLKPKNFAQTVILFLVILVVILIIRSLILPTPVTPTNNTSAITNLNVTGVKASVNIVSSTTEGVTNRILIIYVTNLASMSAQQIEDTINAAFAREGLKRGSIPYQFQEYTLALGEELTEQQLQDFLSNKISYDPTNPLSYPEFGNTINLNPNIVDYKPYGTSFAEYVRLTSPVTEIYEIYLNSGNNYTVYLKNGFTQQEFEGFLNQAFTDKNLYTFDYVDLESLKTP